MNRLGTAAVTVLVATAFCLTGCTTSDNADVPTKFTPDALENARQAALTAAGGNQVGGSINFLTAFGGEELDDYAATLRPFEDATGIEVKFESTRDIGAVLSTRVDGGNPPDVALSPTLGLYQQIAKEGKLIDVREVVGSDVLAANFDERSIAALTVNGQVTGVPNLAYLNSVIWYDPASYPGPVAPKSWTELQDWATKTARGGTPPWCVTLESGAATGWPGADFIDDIMLQQAGPTAHAQWANGELSWTDPRIKSAFETWGQIVNTPGMTFGDKSSVLSTNFENGADPMLAEPPQCFLHPGHVFMGGIIQGHFPDAQSERDLDYFPTPTMNPEFDGVRSISLEAVALFTKTPQAAALAKYLSSPAYGTLLAQSGRWNSPNTHVDTSNYTDPFLKKASEIVKNSTSTDLIANGFMPQNVVEAFWKGAAEYVQDPAELDEILATIDRARIQSNGGQ